MTEHLKKLILQAADILKSYGAKEVFFFGSSAKAGGSDGRPIDLAVSGLAPDVFYKAMGAVLGVIGRRCNLVDLDERNPYVDYLKSHGKLQPDLVSRIRNELAQLHRLLDRHSRLLDAGMRGDPGDAALLALAALLHLLYHGFDKIFTMIAAEYDGGLGKSSATDAEVLERMTQATPGRAAVITAFLAEQLHPYMSFRQTFCHTYAYDLAWSKIRNLVFEAEEILLLVDAELSCFMKNRVPEE